MQILSDSFDNEGSIDVKYAHERVNEGKNLSPQLNWQNVHENIKSFVIAMVDNHPIASNWVHWLIVNIPTNIMAFPEGASNNNKMPVECEELENTFGFKGYGGPMPPIGSGKHNYVVTLYALDIEYVELKGRISEAVLLKKIRSHILDKATLTGFLER